MEESRYFVEVQDFRQRTIWMLLGAALLLAAGFFGYGMIQQLVFDRPWGSKPLSDSALAVVGPAAIAFFVALFVLFRTARLVVRVAPDALLIRFRPFTTRRIAYSDIASVEPRRYRPLLEYGGWGVRWGPGGMAYNVSGNLGVQLHLSNGKRVLLGSQQPQALAQAIRQRIDANT